MWKGLHKTSKHFNSTLLMKYVTFYWATSGALTYNCHVARIGGKFVLYLCSLWEKPFNILTFHFKVSVPNIHGCAICKGNKSPTLSISWCAMLLANPKQWSLSCTVYSLFCFVILLRFYVGLRMSCNTFSSEHIKHICIRYHKLCLHSSTFYCHFWFHNFRYYLQFMVDLWLEW